MKIYIGADHRGFELKEELKKFLIEKEYEVEDLGAFEYDQNDDYPDFARQVAERVAGGPQHSRGGDWGFLKKNKNDVYPVSPRRGAERGAGDPEHSRGVLLCGSGTGMDAAA